MLYLFLMGSNQIYSDFIYKVLFVQNVTQSGFQIKG